MVRVSDLVPWSSIDIVLEDAAKHAHIHSTSNHLHRTSSRLTQAALHGPAVMDGGTQAYLMPTLCKSAMHQ